MNKPRAFVNRRQGDRRTDPDPCENLPMDLYHRKRRKLPDRRAKGKSLTEDYYDFIAQRERE